MAAKKPDDQAPPVDAPPVDLDKTTEPAETYELGTTVDLGNRPGWLVFPDGGISSHVGTVRCDAPGRYQFETLDPDDGSTIARPFTIE
jgi:hypothetical protein